MLKKVLVILMVFILCGCQSQVSKNKQVTTSLQEVEGNAYIELSDTNDLPDDQISNDDESHVTVNSDDVSTTTTDKDVIVSKDDNEMISVSLSIDCISILDHTDDLKDGYEEFVPSNGVILANKSLSLKKDSTVIDALKLACKQADIKLVALSSVYGVYVKGIANLEEKVCGSTSGWMYKVNGKLASYSAGNYRLSDGDKVEWRFSCKQGDV